MHTCAACWPFHARRQSHHKSHSGRSGKLRSCVTCSRLFASSSSSASLYFVPTGTGLDRCDACLPSQRAAGTSTMGTPRMIAFGRCGQSGHPGGGDGWLQGAQGGQCKLVEARPVRRGVTRANIARLRGPKAARTGLDLCAQLPVWPSQQVVQNQNRGPCQRRKVLTCSGHQLCAAWPNIGFKVFPNSDADVANEMPTPLRRV